MTFKSISRRDFVKGSASAIALVSFPSLALGQTTIRVRLEWQDFKTTPQYASFFNAIRTMRANGNQNNRSSWLYWRNVHVNYCPHSIAYFLAWHRGYLYYFDQQLRTVSGDNALVTPYWDYYKYPRMPSEFTDPSTGNPFYVQRAGSNVYNALDLSPFSAYNYQRGTSNSFEPRIESAPHNPVHNLIGGVMATLQSPTDPIFYLHHANIDRLQHAWALPDGKGIPYTDDPYNAATSSSYWAGNFTYSSTLTLARAKTYHPGRVGIDFANNNPPTALPPQASRNPIKLIQAQTAILNRPPNGGFASAPGRAISASARSLGGVSDVALDERSVTAVISLTAPSGQALQDTLSIAAGAGQAPAGAAKSVRIVLDNIVVTGAGKNGGYFYNVYVNLPASGDSTGSRQKHFLGTLGAFEVAGVEHHGSLTLEYPATEVLVNTPPADPRELAVSLVRVDGDNAPKGRVMNVKEIRVEVSTEDPVERSAPASGPRGGCYC